MKTLSSNPKMLLVSSFPPRECGIATSTQDLSNAINKIFGDSLPVEICALENNPYPGRKYGEQVNQAKKLLNYYNLKSNSDWEWYEDYMTYANSILPEAMMYAFLMTCNKKYKELAAGVKGQFPKGINEEFVAKGNRLKTSGYLQVDGYKNIYAIGDIAALISKDTPKVHPQVAQAAIQQGKYLAESFLKLITDKPIKPFEYIDKGSLATVGKRKAVADLGKFKFEWNKS